MLKKICNYSALLLFSLAVTAGAVSANPYPHGPVRIEGKASVFYNKFLTAKTPQSYSVTVKEGQETSVKLKSSEGISVKLYLPTGEVKEYRNEKNLNLTFHAAGEYVIELNSSVISQYTMKVSTR